MSQFTTKINKNKTKRDLYKWDLFQKFIIKTTPLVYNAASW